MSSPESRKRQHNEVVQFPSSSSRPNKQRPQLKSPPKPIDAAPDAGPLPPPSLLDLPAGVVANVGKFMDTRKRPGDLMAICVVFGSDVAKVVRKTYLENNLVYLLGISDAAYSVAMIASDKRFDQRPHPPKSFRRELAAVKIKLEEWMKENEWWKRAALLETAYHEDNAKDGLPAIFNTLQIKAFATEEEKIWFKDQAIAISTSGQVDLYDYQSHVDDDNIDEDYSIVLSVNGTLGTSFNHVKELLLEEDSDKTLKMVHHAFADIFFNPALMIDLGLLDVLRFQVEEMKLDLNYQKYAGIHFRSPENDDRFQEGMTLILHSLVQPDERIFEYVLALENVETIPELERDLHGNPTKDWPANAEHGHSLLHALAMFTTYPLIGNGKNIDLTQRIRLLLEKGTYDLNASDYMSFSPLEYLCLLFLGNSYGRRQFDLARLFLSFGADISEYALLKLKQANKARTNDEDDGRDTSKLDITQKRANCYHAGDMLALFTTTKKMRDAEKSKRGHSSAQ